MSLQINYEFCSNVDFAANLNTSVHFFNDLFAYREAKTGALHVSAFIFFKLSKINEQVFDTFLWHANSIIFDLDLKGNVLDSKVIEVNLEVSFLHLGSF